MVVRTIVVVLIGMALCGTGLAQVAAPPEKTLVPAGTANAAAADAAATHAHTVSVMFSATDANGVPLKDVNKNQVVVLDNERTAEVLDVQSASDLPLDLVIVLLATPKDFGQQQAAAIELVQKLIRPGKDRAMVMTARGEKPWPGTRFNWSLDPNALAEAIKALDKNTGLPDAFTYEVKDDQSHLARIYTQPIATPPDFTFFNVVFAMMRTDPRPVRKAVVLFRTPMAHAPGWGARSAEISDQVHGQIIRIAQAMNVSFYTIATDEQVSDTQRARADIASSYTPTHAGAGSATRVADQNYWEWKKQQFDAGRNNIERIANETGGRAYWTSKKNYADASTGIINDLGARSVVTFVPPEVAANPVHPLKVQVARASRVSAARVYVLPEKK